MLHWQLGEQILVVFLSCPSYLLRIDSSVLTFRCCESVASKYISVSSDCDTAEHVAGAAQKVAEAESTAQAAQLQLTQAEARAESAEQAKIELSLKLAAAIAQTDTGSDVSGMPSNKASEAGSDSLQKRYVKLHHLHVHVCVCVSVRLYVCVCLCVSV